MELYSRNAVLNAVRPRHASDSSFSSEQHSHSLLWPTSVLKYDLAWRPTGSDLWPSRDVVSCDRVSRMFPSCGPTAWSRDHKKDGARADTDWLLCTVVNKQKCNLYVDLTGTAQHLITTPVCKKTQLHCLIPVCLTVKIRASGQNCSVHQKGLALASTRGMSQPS